MKPLDNKIWLQTLSYKVTCFKLNFLETVGILPFKLTPFYIYIIFHPGWLVILQHI
jgi:hypothetical protein